MQKTPWFLEGQAKHCQTLLHTRSLVSLSRRHRSSWGYPWILLRLDPSSPLLLCARGLTRRGVWSEGKCGKVPCWSLCRSCLSWVPPETVGTGDCLFHVVRSSLCVCLGCRKGVCWSQALNGLFLTLRTIFSRPGFAWGRNLEEEEEEKESGMALSQVRSYSVCPFWNALLWTH